MDIKDIANRLVELSRNGEIQKCYDELYSDEVVSIEPKGFDGPKVTNNKIQMLQKLKAVAEKVEAVHSLEIGDPIIAANHFALAWNTAMTMKDSQKKATVNEIIVYEVVDNKIVKEHFFYREWK